MKKLLYIWLILFSSTILYSQTYDSTNGLIFKGDGSVKHSHSNYLNTGSSLTYTVADSNKYLQLTSSGTFTLTDVSSSSSVTWGTITGILGNQTDLSSEFGTKAPLSHTHPISEVDYLQDSLTAHSTTFTLLLDSIYNYSATFTVLFDSLAEHRIDIDQLYDTLSSYSLTSHNHKFETISGVPDTTGHTGEYLRILAGGGFDWESPSSGSTIPAGVIVMWSGAAVDIPSGWALCDGTGGTPDLRDKFIIGAGGNYAVDSTGGNELSLSDNVTIPLFNTSSTVTGISIDNESLHTHSVTSNVTVGNHSDHTMSGSTGAASAGSTQRGTTASTLTLANHTHTAGTLAVSAHSAHSVTNNAVTSGTGSAHTHGVTDAGHSHNDINVIGAVTNGGLDQRPPFYALCYIMKQ